MPHASHLDPIVLLERATPITADAEREAAVVLHTALQLESSAGVRSARLVATARGIYEARIAGIAVDDSVFNPGWTAYEWRLQVQEFDVTALISEHLGDTGATGVELSFTLGNGWWRGDMGFLGANANYGDELALLAALEITFEDGTTQVVATGNDWSARRSENTANSMYNGQRIDARMRGAAPEALAVHEAAFARGTLVPQIGPAILRHETIAPQRVWSSPSGRTLVDFGQNLVGWVRVRTRGERGAEIVLRHAEVLENDELGTRPLRGAQATDTFVLSGGDDEFEPTLTFHGFRYAEVSGIPEAEVATALEAVVVHSEMRRTGWFECSDERVNRLFENSIWGQKGNFLEVPTDCPQRDERLGWTGDISAFAATAAFQFDVADFLHKWLLDLAVETEANGSVPNIVPDVLKFGTFPPEFQAMKDGEWKAPTAIWGDAAVWVPEALWRAYGDRERLAAHYPGMVLHLESVLPWLDDEGLWSKGFQFGDWLDPDASPDEPWAAKADKNVVATACLYRSASFAAEAARELGRTEDAERWQALATRTRIAFNAHYVDQGRVQSDCATVYALAICFGLLDTADRAAAGERLAEVVRERDYRVTTGFAGTPFVTWALSETGHIEDAYRLLLEDQCPSWLYPVTMGATTIWERWDSMQPDGSINPGEMTSFNHYALGAVVDWIVQVVGGIRPLAPGYARLRLQPAPGPGLDWARTALETPHGRVECAWQRSGEAFVIDATVPVGVAAEIVLPDGSTTEVGAGSHHFEVVAGAAG